jgi:PAS domain S-box-containing protein
MTKRRRPAKRSAELEELRARLAEAQETLDAIRHGEVDALVVQDERGERIYSLTGAELPYRMLIEQMQEGAVTVDADGQILYANARFATLSGLALERVIGRPIGQLVAESDAPALLAMIATGAGRQEMEIIGATGTATSTLVSATRLDIGGVPCVGFIVTDLTPQKHHEERLALLAREREARADAEAASRAKDEFLAILSHELRTPLNAIFGWARMLRSQEPASEMAARAIAVIERNAMAQVRMIEDLLDISRVITGKMRLDVRPLDLAPVVAAAVESMTPAAQAKGITLEVVVAPGVGPVLADPQRMQQVVWNLVSNAIKFTAAGGRVSV